MWILTLLLDFHIPLEGIALGPVPASRGFPRFPTPRYTSNNYQPYYIPSPPTTPPKNHNVVQLDGISAPLTLSFDSRPIPQPQLLSLTEDPLQHLPIKSDLCREVRANYIAQHRATGN
ncbi:hypothetical protein PSTT_06454 [Puccinia striiformis]|uniref:Uncharacterized protein n=2 Tax=Puccinia striiformis TaxID=27350 RepID=A0A0L0V3K4_9BASI|nr:hypothetical protein PSTG_12864 [Puccinia striiformis f. sp. tritici PST-78]POW09964.1 hypothetical protein PSTT_06454 [Puccinia striiformis]